jgi:hypothetical protein
MRFPCYLSERETLSYTADRLRRTAVLELYLGVGIRAEGNNPRRSDGGSRERGPLHLLLSQARAPRFRAGPRPSSTVGSLLLYLLRVRALLLYLLRVRGGVNAAEARWEPPGSNRLPQDAM